MRKSLQVGYSKTYSQIAMCSALPRGYVYTNFSLKTAAREESFYCNALTSEQEIKKWVKKFGEDTCIEWRIARTFPHVQHIKCSYKIAYRCQHSKSSHIPKSSSKREAKSTDCPAQLIIRRIGEKKRGSTLITLKNKHNHIIGETATSLKHEEVCKKAQDETVPKTCGRAVPRNIHLVLVNETVSSICEMDTKTEIKEEDPLSDVTSHREGEFLAEDIAVKTNSDALLSDAVYMDGVSDMVIKTEIKTEGQFPDLHIQEEAEVFTKHIKEFNCNNSCEINIKREIEEEAIIPDSDLQNKGFLSEEPLNKNKKVTKYSSDHEIDGDVEIKKEPCWLKTETSFVCNENKGEDFIPVKLPRLTTEAVSDDINSRSPLLSAKELRKDISFHNGKEHHRRDVSKTAPVEINADLEQSDKFSSQKMYSKTLCLKQNRLIHSDKKPYMCDICEKTFTQLSHMKLHNLIHKGIRPHKCNICEKRFTQLSHLKKHILVHEGIKPHKCKMCEKAFTQLSSLKSHNLIHEGIKPYKCELCEKGFARSSNLKVHSLIHEGKKPHKCQICEQNFTTLSNLRRHNFIHRSEKPHKCEICENTFSGLPQLKRHLLIHESKGSYKCKICEKSFVRLSQLNVHSLIHEGKKPHSCEICKQSFIGLSRLKKHNLIHKGIRPYKCKVCEKSFTRLQYLKAHSYIHKGK